MAASKYIYYDEKWHRATEYICSVLHILTMDLISLSVVKIPIMRYLGNDVGTILSIAIMVQISRRKKENTKNVYTTIYSLLKDIFECKDISENQMKNLVFKTGLPVDHILKVIKWLFIEQDIRYWNYSGSNLTWGLVPNPCDDE